MVDRQDGQLMLGAIAWGFSHPLESVMIAIGMRYAPSLVMDLGFEYTKNSLKFMGQNAKSTVKVARRHMARPKKTPRGAKRMGLSGRGAGTIGIMFAGLELYKFQKNPKGYMEARRQDPNMYIFGLPVMKPEEYLERHG